MRRDKIEAREASIDRVNTRKMMDLDISVKVNALIIEYLVHGTASTLAEVEKSIQCYFDFWHERNPGKRCSPSNDWLANWMDGDHFFLYGTPHQRYGSAQDLLHEISVSVASTDVSSVHQSSST